MATFIAAYLIVWLGVAIYVVRLGVRQRRLERALAAFEREAGDRQTSSQPGARAA